MNAINHLAEINRRVAEIDSHYRAIEKGIRDIQRLLCLANQNLNETQLQELYNCRADLADFERNALHELRKVLGG